MALDTRPLDQAIAEASAAVVTDVQPAGLMALPELTEAEQAHVCHESILAAKEHIERGFLWLGARLAQFQDHQWWQTLGHETFEEYLASPEVGFSRSTAYKLIGVHREFIERRGLLPEALAPIGVEKLDIVRHVLARKPETDLEELLEEAKTTGKADFIVNARERVGTVPVTTQEQALAEDRQLLQLLNDAVVGGSVALVGGDRLRGYTVHVAHASGGAKVLRFWAPAGLRLEMKEVLSE